MLLSCFHKAEIFLGLDQKKARAFKGLVKPLQSNVQLVAHLVGGMISEIMLEIKTNFPDFVHNHVASSLTIDKHAFYT